MQAGSINDLPWSGTDQTTFSSVAGYLWGPSDPIHQVVGQLFVAGPSDNFLTSFTFYADNTGTAFDYEAGVYDYTTSTSLYLSGPESLGDTDGYEALTSDVPDISLISGDDIIVYLVDSDTGSGGANLEMFRPGSGFTDGEGVYENRQAGVGYDNFSGWGDFTGHPVNPSGFGTNANFAFDIETSSTPEPATIALMAGALLGIGLLKRKRAC